MMLLNGCSEVKETPLTAMVWRHQGYKFTLHLMLIIISHPSLLLALAFLPVLSSANHRWRTREAPSVNALPPQGGVLCPTTSKLHHQRHPDLRHYPGSPSVASSRRPCSLVFEQGNASRKIPMLDPSSFIVDTSRDEELARKLFGDLNRDILGPPSDGKIIVLDDSDDDDDA
jgi:hypothetical protein